MVVFSVAGFFLGRNFANADTLRILIAVFAANCPRPPIRIIAIRIIGIVASPVFLITSPILLGPETVMLFFWIYGLPTTRTRLVSRQLPQFLDSVFTAPIFLASFPFFLALFRIHSLFFLWFNLSLLLLGDFT